MQYPFLGMLQIVYSGLLIEKVLMLVIMMQYMLY